MQLRHNAGNDMPTDAFIHVICRLRIASSSTMLVAPNVELSPSDRYSYAKLKTARILLFCPLLKYLVIIGNMVSTSGEDCACNEYTIV